MPRCCRRCWPSRSAILIVPVTLQIFSRYTALIPSYIWTEEMARFLFIWMVMLGAMIGVRESTHFEVDVWPRAVAARRGGRCASLGRLGVLVFALVFVWAGIEFVRFGWNRTSELADLPLWLIFIAWPVTGVTWLVFLGEQCACDDAATIAARRGASVMTRRRAVAGRWRR